MQARVQFLLQIYVAFLCAMGAGFSGDLYSHHSQASHHGQRQARGPHHRNRSISRGGWEDHSADVELLKREYAAVATTVEHGDVLAVLPVLPNLRPALIESGRVAAFTVTNLQPAPLPEWTSRGPPSLS